MAAFFIRPDKMRFPMHRRENPAQSNPAEGAIKAILAGGTASRRTDFFAEYSAVFRHGSHGASSVRFWSSSSLRPIVFRSSS